MYLCQQFFVFNTTTFNTMRTKLTFLAKDIEKRKRNVTALLLFNNKTNSIVYYLQQRTK